MRYPQSICLLLCMDAVGCQFEGSTQISAYDASPQDANLGPGSDSQPAVDDAAAPGPDAAPSFILRLNIAGAAHVGTDFPGNWESDPGFGGACGPFYYTNNSPVDGTVDDPLFTNVAYGAPTLCALGDGLLVAGMYRVRLYFAKIYFGPGCPGGGGVGDRIFDIELEGSRVASNLDVFAEAGCTANGGAPYVATFALSVSDGSLNIEMPASANNSMISAIELQSLF